MTLLIDGYNLLHAVGWAPHRGAGRSLEAARRKLLDWLAEVTGRAEGVTVWVVFDARNGPAQFAEWTHRGVIVRFARDDTADDWIEEYLSSTPTPKTVTVVSNDSRLREAARRAGSTAWGSQEFLDWAITAKRETTEGKAVEPEKPDGPADAAEVAALLQAFGQQKRK